MSKIIYDEQGNFKDLSDEGSQAKNIELAVELDLAIKKLPEAEQKIIEMINEGYSYRELAEQLKISQKTIRKALDKVLDIIK
jgi:RNA polymerase sigma factor (sigma-70 family)